MGTRPSISQSTTLDFEHQLGIAKELLGFAYKVCAGTVQATSEFTRKDYVFFALADKSFATFEAIQVLCERSLLDDAFALVRVMVEGIINGIYVLAMGDEAANDYADFPDFRDWIEFNELRAIAPEAVNATSAGEIEEMRRKYEAVRQRYEKNRNRDWSPDTLFHRAAKIDAQVGGEYNIMRVFVNSAWRKASTYVHGTAASIASRVCDEGPGVVIHRRFTREEAAGILFAANMAIFVLLSMTDIRLGKRSVERWRELYEHWAGKQNQE